LAPDNDVYVMARFSNPDARATIEAQGMRCIVHDMFDPFDDLVDDFDYVYHTALPTYAVSEPLGRWPDSYDKYADATGRLMAHLRPPKGFLFGSTISLYDPPARPWREDAAKEPGETPVPENHHYGIHTHNAYAFTKACNEAVVSYLSRSLNIPTTIIRIGSASGPDGGPMRWRLDDLVEGKPIKVHPEKPTYMRPLFEPDAAKFGIGALEAGRVPPLVLNWCGDDVVTVEEYCTFMGELIGKEPIFEYTTSAYVSLVPDITLRQEILGSGDVRWRDGCQALVEACYPELIK
jgi:nucleoside-diphosphate-sugar epimerase